MFIEGGKRRKGSLIVETAIVLPFFLMVIITISLLVRVTAIEENTMLCFADESHKHAKGMYLTELVEVFHGERLLSKVETVESAKLKNKRVEQHYSILRENDPGKINISLSYELEIPLPLSFNRNFRLEQYLFFRGFIGADNPGEAMGFDAMETGESSSSVYVFPRAGERYHTIDCRVIDVYPVEKVLSKEIMKKYKPCKLCKAETLSPGCLVYCFDKCGKVYHKGSCTVVDRYVVEMDRDEAIERGYTACSFCGGGGDE